MRWLFFRLVAGEALFSFGKPWNRENGDWCAGLPEWPWKLWNAIAAVIPWHLLVELTETFGVKILALFKKRGLIFWTWWCWWSCWGCLREPEFHSENAADAWTLVRSVLNGWGWTLDAADAFIYDLKEDNKSMVRPSSHVRHGACRSVWLIGFAGLESPTANSRKMQNQKATSTTLSVF